MTKDEIREFILKFIKGVRLSFFDFEDLLTALIIYINKDRDVAEYKYDLEKDEFDNANEVLWDLVLERKINPAPLGTGKSGSTRFLIKK